MNAKGGGKNQKPDWANKVNDKAQKRKKKDFILSSRYKYPMKTIKDYFQRNIATFNVAFSPLPL